VVSTELSSLVKPGALEGDCAKRSAKGDGAAPASRDGEAPAVGDRLILD